MNILLMGFGIVGQSFIELLLQKQSEGFAIPRIVGVSTLRRGSLYHATGLDLAELRRAILTGHLDAYPEEAGLKRDLNGMALIEVAQAQVFIESTYTNLRDGQPAIDYCRAALERGMHLITANKGPIALAYPALRTLAEQKNRYLGFEATVMSGTPAIEIGLNTFRGAHITAIRGIFNGTTNYILTQMESGLSYTEALRAAQELGYAEADPTADVEGWDTLSKVLILANTLMGGNLTVADVARRGISHITGQDVDEERANNRRWKLLGSIERAEDGQLIARVEPQRLSLEDPLAMVSGITNAISYSTDLLGDVTLIGAGAGGMATAFALWADYLRIPRP